MISLLPRYYRKVIKIRAQDSPNVRLGLAQKAAGVEPTDEILVPGVLSYSDYVKRRETWDKIRQCVGLDAEFYEGPQLLMFPALWLDYAESLARATANNQSAEAMGVDSAQGGDNTCWCPMNLKGIKALIGKKTPDTSVIPEETKALMQIYGVPAESVMFDRGGGGKEHADRMRKQGYNVRTVAFGEAPSSENLFRRMKTTVERKEEREERYAFKSRRAEMYYLARQMIDPSNETGFAIPSEILNRPRLDGGPSLREQLSKIPLTYDQEGRIYLIPKNKRDKDDKQPTLTELIGCSPDEADAMVLGVFGLLNKARRSVAGAL